MKYKLTDETREWARRILHRIEAVTDFGNVKAGDKGGWIEKEENLAHDGDCWVYGNACVCGDARVSDNARVYGDARVFGNACVFGNARVSDKACVYGTAWVFGDARVYGGAWVYGDTRVYGDARVCGDAWVYGDAWVSGDARVSGDAWEYGDARVYGDAWEDGDAWVFGDACVCGDADIKSKDDIIWLSGLGSENRTTTIFRTKDGNMLVSCGCFSGDLAAFEAKVKETHGDSKYAREYLSLIETAKIHFEEES